MKEKQHSINLTSDDSKLHMTSDKDNTGPYEFLFWVLWVNQPWFKFIFFTENVQFIHFEIIYSQKNSVE